MAVMELIGIEDVDSHEGWVYWHPELEPFDGEPTIHATCARCHVERGGEYWLRFRPYEDDPHSTMPDVVYCSKCGTVYAHMTPEATYGQRVATDA